MRQVMRFHRPVVYAIWACLIACYFWLGTAAAQTDKTAKAGNTGSSAAAIAAYSAAANMQNDNEFELAAEEWKAFLKKYPADSLAPQARHYLGVCLMQQNRFKAASEAFQHVVKKHPDFEFVDESHLNLGWCQYSDALSGAKSEYSAAAKTLTQFLAERANSKLTDQALFYLGECLYLDEKKNEAIPVYRRLVKDHADSPLRPDALYALGVAQQETDKVAEANQTFVRFLTDFDEHELASEIRLRQAETLIAQDRFADAEKLFAVVAKDSDFKNRDQALFRQAFCVLRQQRYDEAARLYARIPAEQPDSPLAISASLAAGQAYFQAENFAQASAWLEKVVAQDDPAAFEATHWLCRVAMQEKNPDKAKDLAVAAIAKAQQSPFLPTLMLDQADALYELPDGKQEALSLYLKIVNQHGQDSVAPQALYNGAFAAMELKQYDDAMDHASDFMLRFAKHRLAPDALYVSAESHLLSGQHAEAEWIYAKLIDGHKSHHQVPIWRLRHAAALQIQDKHKDALASLQQDVTDIKKPDLLAETHYLIGLSQSRLGDTQGAIDSLEASLQASTNWQRADDTVLLLSQSLLASGKKAEAQQVFDRFKQPVGESDRQDAILYQLAEAKYQSGEYGEALKNYSLILERWPNSDFTPDALFGKSWSQFKTGDAAAAAQTLSTLIENHAGHELLPRAFRTRAVCRQMTADYKGSIADIETYLQTEPTGDDKADALYIRGLCESALGKNDNALETLGSILKDHAEYGRTDRVLYELAWLMKTAGQVEAADQHFARIAEQYPDSGLAAEANYHIAEKHYKEKEYRQGIDRYTIALTRSTSPNVGEKAAYKLGWSHYQLAAFEPALDSFRNQVNKFPQGELVADGRFMIGECLFKSGHYKEAMKAYQDVPLSELAEDSRVLAQLHAGQAAAQLEKWPVAVEQLSPVIDKYPNSPFVSEAAYELARAHHQLEQDERAEELYRLVVERSQNAVGARARFMLGELYFARQDFQPALQEFQRLVYGYGGSDAADEIKTWQAKAGLEAGRVLAIQAGQETGKSRRQQLIKRAEKYLRYVVEQHRDTPEAKAASGQLKKMGA